MEFRERSFGLVEKRTLRLKCPTGEEEGCVGKG